MLHKKQGAEQSPNKSKVCTLVAVLPVHTADFKYVFLLSVSHLTCWAHLYHWGFVKVIVTIDGQLGDIRVLRGVDTTHPQLQASQRSPSHGNRSLTQGNTRQKTKPGNF